MYRLVIKKSAGKELDDLPNQVFLKIDKAILSLKENPFPPPQSIKLKGENTCRLRVGDYRIVYLVDDKQRVITVYRIRHRKEVYR